MKDAPNKAHTENINNIIMLAPLSLNTGRGLLRGKIGARSPPFFREGQGWVPFGGGYNSFDQKMVV
jgi:hypothetical protein